MISEQHLFNSQFDILFQNSKCDKLILWETAKLINLKTQPSFKMNKLMDIESILSRGTYGGVGWFLNI